MIKCFAAHNSFWINPQGYIHPCARFKESFEHISSFDDLSKITASQNYLDLRESLNNNIWPKACYRCKEDEENNLSSKRSFYDRIGLKTPDDFMIDISMGNFCNLKCRMCGPNNSTLWINDYEQLVSKNLVSSIENFAGYQLTQNDFDKIYNLMKNIKGRIFLELKGGEPLIMPQTRQLVDKIISLPNADRLTLLIVTNGTVAPAWLKDVADKIEKFILVVSIDGIGDVYDYIRGTSKFSFVDCIKNISYYNSIENIDLKFNVVVQNLNIHQQLEIYETLRVFNNTTINYITLSSPRYLAVNVMERLTKETLFDFYKGQKDRFGPYQQTMDNIYNFMMTDFQEGLLEEFKNVTRELDKLRKQDIEKVLPHLVQ